MNYALTFSDSMSFLDRGVCNFFIPREIPSYSSLTPHKLEYINVKNTSTMITPDFEEKYIEEKFEQFLDSLTDETFAEIWDNPEEDAAWADL